MIAQHTPGPWKFSRWDQFGDARFYISQQECAPYTPNYSDVATLIAETPSGELVKIQEANARLIAAAPDLLEALKELSRSFIGTYSDDQRSDDEINNHREHWERMARAAITKAEGGAA